MKIAIIGMGAAGVSVLRAMAQDPFHHQQQITVYDDAPVLGTGLPYQPDSELLLLNQPADTMSLNLQDRLDFVKWVEREKGRTGVEKSHLPRFWYGEYTRALMGEALQRLDVTVRAEAVQNMTVEADGSLRLDTEKGREQFDLVHLCMGHLPYQDPYQLIDHPRYIHHPYPVVEKLRAIPDGAKVGIIGTGLTALDILRYLMLGRRNMEVTLMSDTGTFSTLRGREPAVELQYLNIENLRQSQRTESGLVSLDTMLGWFQKECAAKGVDWRGLVADFGTGDLASLSRQLQDERDLGILQAILHQMDSFLAEYWLALTEEDQQRFLKDCLQLFETFRSPIPRETIQELVAWWRSGEIQVLGGMDKIAQHSESFTVSFANGERLEMEYLVNATGQVRQVQLSRYNPPLLQNLLNQRILLPDESGGVTVLWPSSCAISQRYGVLENLIVHGQLIEGTQFGNNTVGTLAEHAHDVVARFSKKERQKETSPE